MRGLLAHCRLSQSRSSLQANLSHSSHCSLPVRALASLSSSRVPLLLPCARDNHHVRPFSTAAADFRASAHASQTSPDSQVAALYAQAAEVIDEHSGGGGGSGSSSSADRALQAAIATVKQAAAAGLPAAVGRVGRWHLFGLCGCEKSARQAIVLLHRAAVAGDAIAQQWLGQFFSDPSQYMDGDAEDTGTGGAGAAPALSPAAAAASAAAAKQVMEEIKQLRKLAKVNKVRRVQGLAEISLAQYQANAQAAGSSAATASGAASVSGSGASSSASSFFEREDMSKVPLYRDFARAHYWLTCAAGNDLADAQVALGNLCMSAEPKPLYAEGLSWYAIAAQVMHHSLPQTLSSSAVGLKGYSGTIGGTRPAEGEETVDLLEERAREQKEKEQAAAAAAASSSSADADDSSLTATLASPAAPNLHGTPPHPDALYNLGLCYYDGIAGVLPQDKRRAAAYFMAAAEQFDPSALFWLGQAYFTGAEAESAGIERDVAAALRHLELAASLLHPGAMHYLARLHRQGERGSTVLPRSPAKAAFFLQQAVEQEHAEALLECADAVFHGTDGLKKDWPMALDLYQRAAAAGSAEAAANAGAMLYRGLGCTPPGRRQPELALQYYHQAAEQGHVGALESIAALLATGEASKGRGPNLEAARYIHSKVLPVLRRGDAAAEGGASGVQGGHGAAGVESAGAVNTGREEVPAGLEADALREGNLFSLRSAEKEQMEYAAAQAAQSAESAASASAAANAAGGAGGLLVSTMRAAAPSSDSVLSSPVSSSSSPAAGTGASTVSSPSSFISSSGCGGSSCKSKGGSGCGGGKTTSASSSASSFSAQADAAAAAFADRSRSRDMASAYSFDSEEHAAEATPLEVIVKAVSYGAQGKCGCKSGGGSGGGSCGSGNCGSGSCGTK